MLYQLKLRQENRNWAKYFKQEGPYNRELGPDWCNSASNVILQTEKSPAGYPVGAQACLGCRPGPPG